MVKKAGKKSNLTIIRIWLFKGTKLNSFKPNWRIIKRDQ